MDQRRAFDIIDGHLKQTINGEQPTQLLMQILGEGGTGKSKVISMLTARFKECEVGHWLRKGAYTGIAASLIGGSTLHNLAKLSKPRRGKNGANRQKKLKKIWQHIRYLIIDEVSMVSRDFLASISSAIAQARPDNVTASDSAFGGLNVIICGDYHQFPPVMRKGGALYFESNTSKDKADDQVGRKIYEQFTTVVILKEQVRSSGDPEWTQFLRRLREGKCTEDDREMLRTLEVSNNPELMDDAAWADAPLVTPRNAVRHKWNSACIRRHCARTSRQLYRVPAKDRISGRPLTLAERYTMCKTRTGTDRLPESIELAVGMKVMVTFNVHTELDIANGSRGEIVDVVLHPDEPPIDSTAFEVELEHPPAYVLVKLDNTRAAQLPGLDAGVIPITTMTSTFQLKMDRCTHTVERTQLPITPAYAFTDYRAQGQTIEPVIVDLATPPGPGNFDAFNVYVACSRARGRSGIRLLRAVDYKLITSHPCEALRVEDIRLSALDEDTKRRYSTSIINEH